MLDFLISLFSVFAINTPASSFEYEKDVINEGLYLDLITENDTSLTIGVYSHNLPQELFGLGVGIDGGSLMIDDTSIIINILNKEEDYLKIINKDANNLLSIAITATGNNLLEFINGKSIIEFNLEKRNSENYKIVIRDIFVSVNKSNQNIIKSEDLDRVGIVFLGKDKEISQFKNLKSFFIGLLIVVFLTVFSCLNKSIYYKKSSPV